MVSKDDEALPTRIYRWATNAVFGIFIYVLLIAVLLIDTTIAIPHLRNAQFAMGGYFFIAIVLLMLLYRLIPEPQGEADSKSIQPKGILIIGIIAVLAAIVQLYIVYALPKRFITGHLDFTLTRKRAIILADGGTFEGSPYFLRSPNNGNVVILFSWIYKVFGSWGAVMAIGALATNLAVVLSSVLVLRNTKRLAPAVFTCALGELLIGFNWRAFLTYTDNYTMLFVALMLFVYLSSLDWRYKLPLTLLICMIGSWIKVSVLVIGIAIFIDWFFKAIDTVRIKKGQHDADNDGPGTNVRAIVVTALVMVCILASGRFASNALRDHYRLESSDDAKGMQFLLMAGQDETGLGSSKGKQYYPEWARIRAEYATHKERMQACRDVALTWIRERGIVGNIKFYIKKLDACYHDGCFHNVSVLDEEFCREGIAKQIYFEDGTLFKPVTEFFQVLWALLLVLVALPSVLPLFKRSFGASGAPSRFSDAYCSITLYRIAILGVTLFLMLFEGRSKYLFMFLPVFLCYAGNGLSWFADQTPKTRKGKHGRA